jgi:hypothetical protein
MFSNNFNIRAMKKISSLFIFILLFANLLFSQPLTFKYQAVARDTSGQAMFNQTITFRQSILKDSISGTTVYRESHIVSTNDFGLVSMEIGNGITETGIFSDIDWGDNNYYLKTEMDPLGGMAYQLMGISQLLSVPYALYAGDDRDWVIDGDNIISGISGNVGIGANNPLEKLEVVGDIKADTIEFGNGDGTVGYGLWQMTADRDGGLRIGNKSNSDTYGGAAIYVSPNFYSQNWDVWDINTGILDIGIGVDVFHSASYSGSGNIMIGAYCGYNFSTANNNIGIGESALEHMTSGFANIGLGNHSLNGNNGNNNYAIGIKAGMNSLSHEGLYFGTYAGWKCKGDNNIMIGDKAGYNDYTAVSANNVIIGAGKEVGRMSISLNNSIILGAGDNVGKYYSNGNSVSGLLIIDNQDEHLTEGQPYFIAGNMDNDTLAFNADIGIYGKLSVNGNVVLNLMNIPSSSNDAGIKGELAWDENYLYICIDDNTWKRIALSTW